MNKVLFSISFLMLGLISCQNNQKQQPSEAEIERMVNERVDAKMAESNNAAESVETTVHDNQSYNDNTSSELSSKKQYYYEQGRWSGGYDKTHATTEKLKEEFKQNANSHDPADMGNSDLFNEYLRGYEEGQRQRNQL